MFPQNEEFNENIGSLYVIVNKKDPTSPYFL